MKFDLHTFRGRKAQKRQHIAQRDAGAVDKRQTRVTQGCIVGEDLAAVVEAVEGIGQFLGIIGEMVWRKLAGSVGDLLRPFGELAG